MVILSADGVRVCDGCERSARIWRKGINLDLQTTCVITAPAALISHAAKDSG